MTYDETAGYDARGRDDFALEQIERLCLVTRRIADTLRSLNKSIGLLDERVTRLEDR